MTAKFSIVRLCLAVTVCGLLSCTGKRPFRQVQMCLGSEQGAEQFIDTMKSIALSQHMKFVDGSAHTQASLRAMGVDPHYRIMDIVVEREDGMGASAGNSGLSGYEVSIGFAEGADPAAAHRFADAVVGTLKKRWPVHKVPDGQGALPIKGCPK